MADRAYADGDYSGDDASYRRGRSERTGRYVSRRSYGDSDHMSQTIERMMQGKSGEEREVLERCMEMIDRYA